MTLEEIRKKYGINTTDKKTTQSEKKSTDGKMTIDEIRKKYGLSSGIDQDYINSFVADTEKYSSADMADSYRVWNELDLGSRANAIRGWLDKNKTKYTDQNAYKQFSDAIDSYLNIGKEYSSFADEKAYGDWYKSYQTNLAKDEEMRNADLEALAESITRGEEYLKIYNEESKMIPALEISISRKEQDLKYGWLTPYEKDKLTKELAAEKADLERRKNTISMFDVEALNSLSQKRGFYEEAKKFQELEKYKELAALPDFAVNSQYDESNRYGDPVSAVTPGQYTDTGYTDIKYAFINGDLNARSIKHNENASYGLGGASVSWSFYEQMTPEEVSIFNYLYNTQSPEEAYKYVDLLSTELNYRDRMAEQEKWATYAEETPALASIFSVLTAPLKGVSYVGQVADYIDDGKIDENAGYNKFSHLNSAIRNQVSSDIEKNWGKVGSFAYQTGMSMADFLFTTGVSGGSSAMSLAIMGTGAAADTVITAKDRGLSDSQAFLLGTIAGAAEIITEKVSLDALLDATKLSENALGYFLKNVLAEGSEEVGSSLINLVADVLISQDKSEWQTAVDAFMAENPNASDKEAFWHVMGEQALSLGLDFLGGAISGGAMGGGAVGINALSNNVAYNNAIKQHGQSIIDKGGVDPLRNLSYEVAESMEKKDSKEINRLANKVGKKASARNVGKLSAQLEGKITKQNRAAYESALEKNGLSKKEAKLATDYLLDSEDLSYADKYTIENDERFQKAIDAARGGKNLNEVLNSAENSDTMNESEVISDESTDGIHLRNGSKRNDGQNTEESVFDLESSTGAYQSRRKTEVFADSEAARLVNEGREVSVASLGILRGSDKHTVRLVDEGNETPTMKQARARASERGLNVKFFVGDNLVIADDNGKLFAARGYILGNTMLVRADHPYYTSDQITRHEIGHDMIAKGEVNIKDIQDKLIKTVGEENVDSIAEHYATAYEGTNLTPEEIWEECICDSLGDMNIFAGDKTISEFMSPAMSEVKAATESTTKSPTQTRGSPEGKASLDFNNGINTAQDYENYGWVRANDVISAGYWENFTKNFSQAVTKLQKYPKSKSGEFMIAVYDESGASEIADVIVFAKGTIESPVVTKIIQIYEYDGEKLDKYRRNIYALERRGIQPKAGELFEIHRNTDFGSYVEFKKISGENARNNEQPGTDGRTSSTTTEGNIGKASRELDSLGNELTNEQIEYFKNSKVRDANGNLLVVRHGTETEFNIFDFSKAGKNGKAEGYGFYFSDEMEITKRYGSIQKEVYLNITKPLYNNKRTITKAELKKLVNALIDFDLKKYSSDGLIWQDSFLSNYLDTYEFNKSRQYAVQEFINQIWEYNDNDQDLVFEVAQADGRMYESATMQEFYDVLGKSIGYDGIIAEWSHPDGNSNVYVTFRSEQSKNVSNKAPTSNPDIRFSRELDTEYLSAVNRGDMETAQKMVDEAAKEAMPDSKIKMENGDLRKVFHGTNTGDFTEFNPDYIGMSSGDDGFFGMGFYFAYSKGEAAYYGAKRIITAYLNLKNPFDFQSELQMYNGKRASSGYAPDAVALMNFADKFPNIAKDVKIGVVENGSDVGKDISLIEFSKAFKEVIENKTFEYSEVTNEFGEKETVVTADPEVHEYEYNGEKHTYKDYGFQKKFWGTPNELDVAYEYLANAVYEYVDMLSRTRLILDNNREFTAELKAKGYDGTIQSKDGDEAVAFYPEQVKSADPVTYDDNGDVIPLSERFNPKNSDIRYSRELDTIDYIDEQAEREGTERVGVEPLSNREILADALESAAKDATEKKYLGQYKDTLYLVEGAQKKLAELRADIAEIKYSKSLKEQSTGQPMSVKEFQQKAYETAAEKGVDKKNVKFKLDTDTKEYFAYVGDIKSGTLLVADKTAQDKSKLALMERTAANVESNITKYDEKLLRLEALKPIKDILARERAEAYREATQKGKEKLDAYREKSKEALRETVEHYQEARRKNVESRHKTEMRHKINKVAHELDALLNRGTKERNVKKGQSELVRRVLDLSDMLFATDDELIVGGIETDLSNREKLAVAEFEALYDEYHSYDESVTENKEKRKELRTQMNEKKKELAEALERERKRISKAKASGIFDALAKEYEALKNSEHSYIRNAFEKDTLEHIKKLGEDVGDTLVKDMTLDQMESIYKAFRMVKTMVSDSNKLFNEEIKESAEKMGQKALSEVRSHGHKEGFTKPGKAVSELAWNNLKPIYLMERIGSKTLQDLFQNILNAESEWAKFTAESQAFIEEQKKKFGYDKWDFKKKWTFKNETGQEYELNLEQMFSIYAYAKRGEQALNHLRGDGFVFDKVTVKKKGVEIELNDKTAYKVTDAVLGQIFGEDGILTEDQKAFVDAMQKYLSDDLAKRGNAVSNKLYGIDLFGEEYYISIRSEGAYLERAREQNDKPAKMKNRGFTKPTQKNSRNPIVLSEFTDLWSGHVIEMNEYAAFTLPLEDFYRVYNYQNDSSDTTNKTGVIPAIRYAYGEAATKAIDRLLDDINGGAKTDYVEGAGKKLIGLFKKAKVMLSLSVIVQQPSAIVRAMSIINPKYFVGQKTVKTEPKLWEEVKKYAPVAIIKEMGYFDTGLGYTAKEWVKGDKTFKDWVDDIISWAPAKADEITWRAIWKAVKRETLHNNPKMNPTSDEFLKLCGKRFEDVIRHTQVYDSTLSRSANMRSKSVFMQMVTSFMAEPTTSINMLEMAVRSGNGKRIGVTAAAVYGSYLLNAILVALPYAMRDDDEDETFTEKYLSALTESFISNSIPLTALPFVKDIWSIAQGYDVERADMSLISDFVDSLFNLATESMKEDSDPGVITEIIVDMVGGFANLTGIPLKNLVRDVKGIINFAQTLTKDFATERNTTWNSLADALEQSVKEAIPIYGRLTQESKADKLFDAIVAGDKNYVDRLKDSYSSESAYESAIRKTIGEKYRSGEITRAKATSMLTKYGDYDENDAYWKLKEWDYEKKYGKDAEWSKYSEFYTAVKTGKNLKAVIKEYTNHGVDTKTLASQITSYYKPLYKKMSKAQRANIKGYLLNAYQLLGYKRYEKSKDIDKWLED